MAKLKNFKSEPVGAKTQFTEEKPRHSITTEYERNEAIALIEQRFEAMKNGTLTASPSVKTKNTPQLFTLPSKPEQSLEVGMLVAVHHNPANAARVVAIDALCITN